MKIGNWQLPSPERSPGDGKEGEESPHAPGLQRQPSLIEPPCPLHGGGEAVVVTGDLRIRGARLDAQGDRLLPDVDDPRGRVDASRAVLVRLVAVNAVPHAFGLADHPQAMSPGTVAGIGEE